MPAKRTMYMIDGKPHWICAKCKEKKPATDFWKNCLNTNGLNANCKVCHRSYRSKTQGKPLLVSSWIATLERMFIDTEKSWKSHEKMRVKRLIRECGGQK